MNAQNCKDILKDFKRLAAGAGLVAAPIALICSASHWLIIQGPTVRVHRHDNCFDRKLKILECPIILYGDKQMILYIKDIYVCKCHFTNGRSREKSLTLWKQSHSLPSARQQAVGGSHCSYKKKIMNNVSHFSYSGKKHHLFCV